MTKKQEPQMMICPNAEKCPTQYMNCPHREQHTEIISGGCACQISCYNNVKCIPYVEPSPEMPLQDSLLKMAKDIGEIIIEHPEWNDPIKSVKQVLAEILRKYDCLMIPIQDARLKKEVLDALHGDLTAHDQQVRKAFADECIKDIQQLFEADYEFKDGWCEEVVAHLRAMAEKE